MVKTPDEEYQRLQTLLRELELAVAQRRRAEEALKAAHAFQQSIIDGVAESIMVIGDDYRVKLMNRAARESWSGYAGASKPLLCHQVARQRETTLRRDRVALPA